jgi:hypothetical protein
VLVNLRARAQLQHKRCRLRDSQELGNRPPQRIYTIYWYANTLMPLFCTSFAKAEHLVSQPLTTLSGQFAINLPRKTPSIAGTFKACRTSQLPVDAKASHCCSRP